MDLYILGKTIKDKRKSMGISLNKMSNDLYGNRYMVNHFSSIEKGDVDVRFTVLLKIFKYLEIKKSSFKELLYNLN